MLPFPRGSGGDILNIIYNQKDIRNSVNVKACVLNDRAGDGADYLMISFSDEAKEWENWNPARGDEIIIKDGGYSTGIMYVDTFDSGINDFIIEAISTPITSKRKKTRIWRSVRLTEIAKDIAREHGLTLQLYGISDYTYFAVSQMDENDIAFLNRMCTREGYQLKVTNGELVIYSEKEFEKTKPKIIITPDMLHGKQQFHEASRLIEEFEVYMHPFGKELISYTAKDPSIQGESERKKEQLSTIAEAERFANAYLRLVNKYRYTGVLPVSYMDLAAAGTTVELNEFGKQDGIWFVDRLSHDIIREKTVLDIRKIG